MGASSENWFLRINRTKGAHGSLLNIFKCLGAPTRPFQMGATHLGDGNDQPCPIILGAFLNGIGPDGVGRNWPLCKCGGGGFAEQIGLLFLVLWLFPFYRTLTTRRRPRWLQSNFGAVPPKFFGNCTRTPSSPSYPSFQNIPRINRKRGTMGPQHVVPAVPSQVSGWRHGSTFQISRLTRRWC